MGVKLPFFKMSGAGNDFVVLDNRQGQVPGDLHAFSAAVSDRRRGIGADGVLLVEPSIKKHFRMRYFNPDGSEADMCGNGARCIARFANAIGAAPKAMDFENLAGDFTAEILIDGRVVVQMTEPQAMRLNWKVAVDGKDMEGHFLNTGVPHFAVIVDDVAKVDVFGLGRKLRRHEAFAPKGTNVNFVQVTGPSSIAVRTYERGVEDETLACGTGCVAAAVLMARLGKVASPVSVATHGGDTLEISFRLDGDRAVEVFMKGKAEVTFEGSLDLDRYAGGVK